MAIFIGSNNRETLLGVIEEIDRLLRPANIAASRLERRLADPNTTKGKVKLRQDLAAEQATIAVLTGLRGTMEMASQNGPTPDLSKLGGIRLTVRPDALERLAAAVMRGPKVEGKSADDVANEMLAGVDLDRLPTPRQQYEADHLAGAHRGNPLDQCPSCPKQIVIDAASDMVGMNEVDPTISCQFCGADLDDKGVCTAQIDDECSTAGSILVELANAVVLMVRRLGVGIKVWRNEDRAYLYQIGSRLQSIAYFNKLQAMIAIVEELAKVQGHNIIGVPHLTIGICNECAAEKGDHNYKLVAFNGVRWDCMGHRMRRPSWQKLGCEGCGYWPGINCEKHAPKGMGV